MILVTLCRFLAVIDNTDKSGAVYSAKSCRMTDQASVSRSRDQAALAGLVEGRVTASRPVAGRV